MQTHPHDLNQAVFSVEITLDFYTHKTCGRNSITISSNKTRTTPVHMANASNKQFTNTVKRERTRVGFEMEHHHTRHYTCLRSHKTKPK